MTMIRTPIVLTMLAAGAVLVLALVQCRSGPRCPLPSMAEMRPASSAQLEAPPSLLAALLSDQDEPAELTAIRDAFPERLSSLRPLLRLVGSANLITPSTWCDTWITGPPWITTQPGEPRAGEEYAANFYTLMLSAPTDWPMVIAVDTQPADYDLSMFGMPGCRLLVHRSMTPSDWWFFPSAESGLFRRRDGSGVAEMRWQIPREWAGAKFYLQPVVGVPRDVAAWGYLLGPALEIVVGSPR